MSSSRFRDSAAAKCRQLRPSRCQQSSRCGVLLQPAVGEAHLQPVQAGHGQPQRGQEPVDVGDRAAADDGEGAARAAARAAPAGRTARRRHGPRRASARSAPVSRHSPGTARCGRDPGQEDLRASTCSCVAPTHIPTITGRPGRRFAMPTPDCAMLASRGILRLTGPDAGTLSAGPDQQRHRFTDTRPRPLRSVADAAGQIPVRLPAVPTASQDDPARWRDADAAGWH